MSWILRTAGSDCALRNGLRFALIGEDVGYSKSPAIFAAIFKQLGKEGEFNIAHIQSAQLQSSLKQLVLEGYRGFSITIPHKQSIVACLDDVDPVVQRAEAVNCVAVDDHHLLGYNTDSFGFSFPLILDNRKSIGEHVLIAGTGGAARAVAHSLYTDFGVRRMTILGRSLERAERCRIGMESRYEKLKVLTGLISGLVPAESPEYDMVVNCTPLGGFTFHDKSPFGPHIPVNKNGIYYDLNYNEANKLVSSARKQGASAIDGSRMLVAQAIRAFGIWTNLDVPFDTIYAAVFGKPLVQAMSRE